MKTPAFALFCLLALAMVGCQPGDAPAPKETAPAVGGPAMTPPAQNGAVTPPQQGVGGPNATTGTGAGPTVPPVTGQPTVPPADIKPADGGKTEPTAPESQAEKENRIYERVKGYGCPEVPNPDVITEGQMRLQGPDGKVLALPLAHTAVEAEVSGFLGQVWVTQYFTNPFDHPIEAIYTFPLPRMAAVDDMEMVIGERVIKGVMKKKEEARQIYEDAKRAGKTASLLDQERPNIFTQSVANIMPGDRIKVRIRYVEDLKYEDGQYEFVFPMVVGPRFIPGSPTGASGTGWSRDTDKVPDASKITPPVLKPGERSGHDIEVALHIHAGTQITELRSTSHEINKGQDAQGRTLVTLAPFDTIPNKDLIVRYRTAGPAIQIASLFHRSEAGGFFMLLFEPEAAPQASAILPRELVFVLDCSGSMSGAPLAASKEAVKKAMKAMRPTDSFQLIQFSDAANGFARSPVPNTTENLRRGLQWVDQLEEGGGTMMIEGIKAALDYPVDAGKVRIVMFLTDGYIGNDDEILAAIDQRIGNSRLFSFGIGSSVNRYLLDRMAEVGRGSVTYLRQDEQPNEAVERFYKRIETPVLVDIRIETRGEVKTMEVFPAKVPDLFAGQPLVVHGKYEGSGPATIMITGRRGDGEFKRELQVVFPAQEPNHSVLATLWARTRIEYLMGKLLRGQDQDIIDEVTRLAIQYRIMSQYTSFVAVEEKVRNVDGRVETVTQPVEMPEGVEYSGVFGAAQPSAPAMVPGKGYRTRASSGTGLGGGLGYATTGMAPQAAPTASEGAAVGDTAKDVGGVMSAEDKKAEEKADVDRNAKNTAAVQAAQLTLDSVVVLTGPLSEPVAEAYAKGRIASWTAALNKLLSSMGLSSGTYTLRLMFTSDEKGAVRLESAELVGQVRTTSQKVREALTSGSAAAGVAAGNDGRFKAVLTLTVK